MVQIYVLHNFNIDKVLNNISNNYSSFKPAAKPSVLRKYGVSLVDFLYAVDVNLDKPWVDFYHEASYKIGVDFFLNLDLDNSEHVLNITQKDMFQEKDGIVRVEEMWTIWLGLCYKYTPLHKTESYVTHFMRIDFDKSLANEDIPNVNMIFTSEKGSSAAIDLDYVGKDYHLEFDHKIKEVYDVNLLAEVHTTLEETSNCTQGDPFYTCVSEM